MSLMSHLNDSNPCMRVYSSLILVFFETNIGKIFKAYFAVTLVVCLQLLVMDVQKVCKSKSLENIGNSKISAEIQLVM